MNVESMSTKCDRCGCTHSDGRLHRLHFNDKDIFLGNTCMQALLELLIDQFGIPSKFNDE